MLKVFWKACPHVWMDYGFLGEREQKEQVSLVLVIRERRHRKMWAMLVPRTGTDFLWMAKRAAKSMVGTTVTLRCDSEPAIEALAREHAHARQEGRQTVPERATGGRQPVQRNHRAATERRHYTDCMVEGTKHRS